MPREKSCVRMTTGSGSFEGSSERKISPEERDKAEIASATWLLVGCLLPAAISDLTNASGEILRSDDPSKLPLPVVIFERFQVERLEIKRDHGWAHLQMESRAIIAGDETNYKRRNEKVRWELRKTESGWEAVAPADRTYVPSDVAVRNLAAQLARLTEGDGTAVDQEAVLRKESQLANLLSGLLDNKAGASPGTRKPQKSKLPVANEEKSEKPAKSGGPS